MIGFSGIVLLVWPDLTLGSASSRGFLAGIVALQVASIGWSIGSSYSKRHAQAARRDSDRFKWLMKCWHDRVSDAGRWLDDDGCRHRCAASGAISSSRRERRSRWCICRPLAPMGGFVAYAYALRHLPVSFVSLYAYINPVIAVALGVLVLHEPFTCAHGGRGGTGLRRCSRRAMAAAAARPSPGRCACRTARGAQHRVIERRSDSPPADQSHEEQHDCNDQQDVDEVAHGVTADDPSSHSTIRMIAMVSSISRLL